jgi:hypothetical protein
MIFMPSHVKKISLLLNLKAETLNQLAAVQAENPEQFLYFTERGNAIIESIESLQGDQLNNELMMECRGILEEIADIRNQISTLIQPLYKKIRKLADAEKQINIIKKRYSQDYQPVPSVFLDKKI